MIALSHLIHIFANTPPLWKNMQTTYSDLCYKYTFF